MSQEKVDKYKQVVWLGYSGYNLYDSSRPKQTAQVDYTAITEYQSHLAAPAAE